MSYLDSLDGKTVVAIDVCDEEEAIRFRFDEGEPVIWQVEGDCCSHSYWHEAFGLNQIRGATVVAARSIELPELPHAEDGSDYSGGECIQAYGVCIVTDKGAGTLVFRNSSNGYYGGWCELATTNRWTNNKWRTILAGDWTQGGTSDPTERLAPTADELFEDNVRAGLAECRKQLSKVAPVIKPTTPYVAPYIEIVKSLQDRPTQDILVLGVYLTRMAEDSIKAFAATA